MTATKSRDCFTIHLTIPFRKATDTFIDILCIKSHYESGICINKSTRFRTTRERTTNQRHFGQVQIVLWPTKHLTWPLIIRYVLWQEVDNGAEDEDVSQLGSVGTSRNVDRPICINIIKNRAALMLGPSVVLRIGSGDVSMIFLVICDRFFGIRRGADFVLVFDFVGE